MLLQETYELEDCRFFDESSNNNVNKYGSSSDFSYNSTEQAYYINTPSAKNITRDSVVGDFDFCCEIDFKIISNNTICYVGESTNGYECQGRVIGASSPDKGVATFYTDSNRSISNRKNNTNYSFDSAKWYHYKVTRVGNILTAQIIDNGVVIATAIDNDVRGTNNSIAWHIYVQSGTLYWKNIKFKPL